MFTKARLSHPQINHLLDMWNASLRPFGARAPFSSFQDLYKTIDATVTGGAPWTSFTTRYTGPTPTNNIPPWMTDTFTVWYREPLAIIQSMFSNADFAADIDYAPYREYVDGRRRWTNFMSGNWAWTQADSIAANSEVHGSMFVPIILGSDKTTVSIATGQNEYWPVYLSIGNIHNNARREHRNGITPIAFLSNPKITQRHSNSDAFRLFRRQLFHSSLAFILHALKPGMSTPVII